MGGKRLDFDRPFMPESFAHVEGLTFLNEGEKRTLELVVALAALVVAEVTSGEVNERPKPSRAFRCRESSHPWSTPCGAAT